jgi:hypothetical protein
MVCSWITKPQRQQQARQQEQHQQGDNDHHQQQKDEDDNDDRQRADALKTWRMECGYSQPSDYIFASADMDGKQPLWPSSAMEDYIRPAAIRAEIT